MADMRPSFSLGMSLRRDGQNRKPIGCDSLGTLKWAGSKAFDGSKPRVRNAGASSIRGSQKRSSDAYRKASRRWNWLLTGSCESRQLVVNAYLPEHYWQGLAVGACECRRMPSATLGAA